MNRSRLLFVSRGRPGLCAGVVLTEHSSQWAAIRWVGDKLGIRTESLRRWVRQAERDGGQRAGLTTDERTRLKQLERENVELKRANEILKTASAYFAQAVLDRRAK